MTRGWLGSASLALLVACSQAVDGGPSDGVGGASTDNNDESGGGANQASGGSGSGGRGSARSGGARGDGGSTDGGSDGASGGASSEDGGQSSGSGGRGNSGGGTSTARDVAEKLGRDHFLIGMGNDGNEDYLTLGPTFDLHYAYLVGLLGMNGWPDWNPGGYYATYVAQAAIDAGTVPMFTLYSMAVSGEGNGNSANDAEYMRSYWEGAKLLFERLDELDSPSVVHFEPDWWAFAQQLSSDPTEMPAKVGSLMPDCADLPEDMSGMGRCLVVLARKYSPKTLVGFHASTWASPDPADTARYLKAIGAADADLLFTDMLDRDAGCFEARGAECTRNDGPWYLDETNQTSPNFHELTSWAKTITDTIGRPMMWWQIPFGVPSETPGGEPGHYRDNKVKYLFEHIDEFVAIGGVGAVFGVGAGNQTYVTTDGGQFKNAATAYFADPYEL